MRELDYSNKDPEEVIRSFQEKLIENDNIVVLSQRRDRWYMEFAKQLFTFGFV